MRRKYIIGSLLLVTAIVVFIFIAKAPVILNRGIKGEGKGLLFSVTDSGRVTSGLMTTGVVEPLSEVLILSPAQSIISKIYRTAGSSVRTGEVILRLDASSVNETIERIESQIEVQKNNLEKNRLSSKSTRVDLDYSTELKKLRIASLKAELADQEQLLEVGGISPASIDKTRQELVIAEKDLQMTREKNSIRLKQLQADENGMLLEIKIREKDLENAKLLLEKMTVRAPSSGIILDVLGKEGERVGMSQTLLRMSDLSQYKITASLDEKYSSFVKTGGMAYTLNGNSSIEGKIGNIRPEVRDNKTVFDVHLSPDSHKHFKPNQNVNLLIVLQMTDTVLRVKKGPAFQNNTEYAYVVRSGKAVRVPVKTGIIGEEFVEIVSGLDPGERVVISDVSSFKQAAEVDLSGI
jgi:HlyD family secretion protein